MRSLLNMLCLTLVLCAASGVRAATAMDQSADTFDLQNELVGAVGQDFSTYRSDHFVIAYNTKATWAVQRAALLEKTFQQFYGSFSLTGFQPQPLHRQLVCVIFRDYVDFTHYAQVADHLNMSWSGGYYSARTNRVTLYDEQTRPQMLQEADRVDQLQAKVVLLRQQISQPEAQSPQVQAMDQLREQLVLAQNELTVSRDRYTALVNMVNIAKVTHETAHQLAFNTGLQTRGVMYPLWVSEGLATNFETENADQPFGPGYDNPTRRRHLVEARERHVLLPLSRFITATRVPTDQPGGINAVYAQAWGLFAFLFKTRRVQLQEYLKALASCEPGRRSEATMRREFTRAFGSLDQLQTEWDAYVKALQN